MEQPRTTRANKKRPLRARKERAGGEWLLPRGVLVPISGGSRDPLEAFVLLSPNFRVTTGQTTVSYHHPLIGEIFPTSVPPWLVKLV